MLFIRTRRRCAREHGDHAWPAATRQSRVSYSNPFPIGTQARQIQIHQLGALAREHRARRRRRAGDRYTQSVNEKCAYSNIAVALIDGRIRVGLDSGQLERLADDRSAVKASRRDLAWVLAKVSWVPSGKKDYGNSGTDGRDYGSGDDVRRARSRSQGLLDGRNRGRASRRGGE